MSERTVGWLQAEGERAVRVRGLQVDLGDRVAAEEAARDRVRRQPGGAGALDHAHDVVAVAREVEDVAEIAHRPGLGVLEADLAVDHLEAGVVLRRRVPGHVGAGAEPRDPARRDAGCRGGVEKAAIVGVDVVDTGGGALVRDGDQEVAALGHRCAERELGAREVGVAEAGGRDDPVVVEGVDRDLTRDVRVVAVQDHRDLLLHARVDDAAGRVDGGQVDALRHLVLVRVGVELVEQELALGGHVELVLGVAERDAHAVRHLDAGDLGEDPRRVDAEHADVVRGSGRRRVLLGADDEAVRIGAQAAGAEVELGGRAAGAAVLEEGVELELVAHQGVGLGADDHLQARHGGHVVLAVVALGPGQPREAHGTLGAGGAVLAVAAVHAGGAGRAAAGGGEEEGGGEQGTTIRELVQEHSPLEDHRR